jgi:asparagine synthase (glutamine-hydrolysing)
MDNVFWECGLLVVSGRTYFWFFVWLCVLFGDFGWVFFAEVLSYGHFVVISCNFDSHGAAAMVNRMLCFDLKTHLQALLQVEDRTSMAWGLESRVPLLDYRLIELLASVPPVIKFKNGRLKYLFRQAVHKLVPKTILQRTDKMGFPVPLNQWMKHELHDFVADILLSQRCRQRGIFAPAAIEAALFDDQPFSRSLWGALCLELWYEQFIDA